jgi:hypothetical protein
MSLVTTTAFQVSPTIQFRGFVVLLESWRLEVDDVPNDCRFQGHSYLNHGFNSFGRQHTSMYSQRCARFAARAAALMPHLLSGLQLRSFGSDTWLSM